MADGHPNTANPSAAPATKRRGLFAAAAALPFGGLAMAAPDPDAELIAACAALPGLTALVNSGAAGHGEDNGPGWQAYSAAFETIDDWQCKTLAGVLAKFRAALVDATSSDGTVSLDGSSGGLWAFEAAMDLLRLQDGGLQLA